MNRSTIAHNTKKSDFFADAKVRIKNDLNTIMAP